MRSEWVEARVDSARISRTECTLGRRRGVKKNLLATHIANRAGLRDCATGCVGDRQAPNHCVIPQNMGGLVGRNDAVSGANIVARRLQSTLSFPGSLATNAGIGPCESAPSKWRERVEHGCILEYRTSSPKRVSCWRNTLFTGVDTLFIRCDSGDLSLEGVILMTVVWSF